MTSQTNIQHPPRAMRDGATAGDSEVMSADATPTTLVLVSERPHRCSRCDVRFGGERTCHCTKCHRTFGALSAFDHHLVFGEGRVVVGCLDPAADHWFELNRHGYWSSAAELAKARARWTAPSQAA